MYLIAKDLYLPITFYGGKLDKKEIGRNINNFCTPIIRGNMPVMRIEILSKRINEFNSYKRTHFLSLSRTLESGVPIMSCILAI